MRLAKPERQFHVSCSSSHPQRGYPPMFETLRSIVSNKYRRHRSTPVLGPVRSAGRPLRKQFGRTTGRPSTAAFTTKISRSGGCRRFMLGGYGRLVLHTRSLDAKLDRLAHARGNEVSFRIIPQHFQRGWVEVLDPAAQDNDCLWQLPP